MFNTWNKIKRTWNDIKKVKSIADDISERYGDNMRNGHWIMLECGKPVLLRRSADGINYYKSNNKQFVARASVWKVVRKNIKNLFYLTWQCKIQNNEDGFKADYILMSRDGSLFFYDLKELMIIKYYIDNRYNDGYLFLEKAGYWEIFRSPVLWIQDIASLEKIILSQENCLTDIDKYKFILKQYRKYFNMTVPISKHKILDVVSRFKELIPHFNEIFPQNILELSINYYKQHGDFKEDNVLFENTEDLYIIDYELAGEYPFFHDILCWKVYSIITGQADWNFIDEILDNNTEIGIDFKNILIEQKIFPSFDIKIALLVLTIIFFIQNLIDNKDRLWSLGGRGACYEKMLVNSIEKVFSHFWS